MQVAVPVMRVVQFSVHQVVRMVPMRNGFVPAPRAMRVPRAATRRLTPYRILRRHRNHRFVHVIPMRHMQVAIVNVGHLVTHPDRRVATPLAMHMRVSAMNFVIGTHCLPSV